jgi:hypothetical protein
VGRARGRTVRRVGGAGRRGVRRAGGVARPGRPRYPSAGPPARRRDRRARQPPSVPASLPHAPTEEGARPLLGDARPTRPRVLVAHEPRAYREALAAALRALRPEAEVVVVEPQDLDGEASRRRPDLVFCSRLGEPVRSRARAWALLYPGGARRVETCVAGRRAAAADLGLAAALALLDRAAAAS